ncbi:sodium:solute symporter family protein [Oceanobacillus halotolerans]|uniref:sodium:solute symporter family protein n=1 Tax=Oceanobacillus halotolerans TaxID=2663380 RepID=UPI0013DB3AFB|nr:sodium:solute symporter family protein [Oceanobacillus halotolerans]
MLFAVGILFSFAIYILIGLYLSRRISNVEDYYVSGRNGSTLMITGSLVASFLSTVSFMGEVGFSYDGYAITLLLLTIFNASGYVIGVFLFGRFLRRSKALTLPEYFGKRFNSSKVRKAAGITTVVGIAAYLVAVTQGGALLLGSILDVPYFVSLIIMWLAYTSFTFLSGAKGVLTNDTLMFIIFVVATFIAIPYIIYVGGGWPEAILNTANLAERPDALTWHGLTGENAYMGAPIEVFLWAIILGVVWGTVVSVSPWQTSRYLMAKNEHVAIRSGIIAMISLMFIYFFLQIGMGTVAAINPNISPSEEVFIWSAMNIMPGWLGVLALTGIMAAALSSCSTFLQLIGNSVAHDLGLKNKNDKNTLLFSRISMVGVSIIILGIALWQPPAIMWIGYFAATLFAASWGPVAFASVFSKRVNKTGAFWAIIMGFLGVVGGELMGQFGYTLPVYLDAAVIGAILSLLSLWIGSKLGEVSSEEQQFREKMLITPEGFYQKRDMAITKKYTNLLIYSGIALIILTFVLYYVPVFIM